MESPFKDVDTSVVLNLASKFRSLCQYPVVNKLLIVQVREDLISMGFYTEPRWSGVRNINRRLLNALITDSDSSAVRGPLRRELEILGPEEPDFWERKTGH